MENNLFRIRRRRMEDRRGGAVAGRSGLEVRRGGLEGGRWSRLRSRRRGSHASFSMRSLTLNESHRVNLDSPTSTGLDEGGRDRSGSSDHHLEEEASAAADNVLQNVEGDVVADDHQMKAEGKH